MLNLIEIIVNSVTYPRILLFDGNLVSQKHVPHIILTYPSSA